MIPYPILEKARDIRLLVLDVDGVLSDGQLYFSNQGDELKAFHVADGLGIKLLQQAGIQVAVITGRRSDIVARRMQALGVQTVLQGRDDKGAALQELSHELGIPLSDIAYMGDDWQDLSAMQQACLALTVPNAHDEVRKRADLVTSLAGGQGAVREVSDLLLKAQSKYDDVLAQFLNPVGQSDAGSR